MNMVFKNRIKKIINEMCNGSPKIFAERLDIASGTMHAWDDEHFPKGDILLKIHKVFHVNIHWLLTDEGEPYLTEVLRDEALLVSPKGTPMGTHAQDFGVPCEAISADQAAARREAASKAANTFFEDVGYLREIYDYGDPGVINAIHSNLQTFAKTIHNDHGVKQRDQKIIELESSIDNKNTIETLIRKIDDIATGQKQIAEETKTVAQKLNEHLEAPHKRGQAA